MLSDIKALLLVGGMGTRLRAVVPSMPKPLALIGRISFLELLVRQLRHQGVRHLVLCTGYLADQIENEFGDGRRWDVTIEYSRELRPLGTAGAVKLAQPYLEGVREFLVLNGDSFLEIDFRRLVGIQRERGGVASLAVRHVENANRYGSVKVNAQGRVAGFLEKASGETPGLINAGVYVFNKAVLDHIPEGPASLERDIFPVLLSQGVYAVEQHGMFIDIGTPEDYARAQELCDYLYEASSPIDLSTCSRYKQRQFDRGEGE